MTIDARIPLSINQLDLGQVYSQAENIKMAQKRQDVMEQQAG